MLRNERLMLLKLMQKNRSRTENGERLKIQQSSTCLFCEGPATNTKPLHQVATFEIDARVRECAANLQDHNLITKLSEGDLIALGAAYHTQCLVSLYNRDRDRPQISGNSDTSTAQATAFTKLVSYMESVIEDEKLLPVFKLCDLKKRFDTELNQLHKSLPTETHSARFKNKLLSHFPNLESHSVGRDVLLVAKDSMRKLLRRLCELEDVGEEAVLSRAANIVRKDISETKCPPFSGSFPDECQQNSVPQSLLTLIRLILYGTVTEEPHQTSQPCLTLAQLMVFNTYARWRQEATENRHTEQGETPLPLFMGALIHSRTRSKDLVGTLFRLGLSVSYDHVLAMSGELGNAAINYFENLGTVCPPKLNTGVFTTSAVDNIDHNPTATSAHGSFHGTGISLFQHPDLANRGTEQTRTTVTKSGKKIKQLSDSYTTVPAIAEIRKDPPIPKV